jgi:hypothetical protein
MHAQRIVALVKRPSFLLPLALLSFLYAGIGVIASWGQIAMLTAPHDEIIKAVRESSGSLFTLVPQVGTEEDQRRFAERDAEVIWARRNAIIPLSVCHIIACTLILLGAGRSLRKSPRAAWGCSAWQLGALLALPCAALDGVISILCSREQLASMANATDPVSKLFREMAPHADRPLIGQAALVMLFLGSLALYLQSAAVKRWVAEGAKAPTVA